MPLWGNQDNAANSTIYAASQVRLAPNTVNQTALFGNTTPDAFITGVTIGQFGVDPQETTADGRITHSGWVLRTEGSGGRAGRVFHETLVAGGSISGDAEDTAYPDYTIIINTQPSSNTWNRSNAVTLTVSAVTRPTGGTLAYKWQQSYAGVPAWTDVPTTSLYTGNTTASLAIANNTLASGNTFRVLVSNTQAATVTSANAVVTAT